MKELVAAGYSYEKYPEVKIVDGVETELQVVTKNSLRILVKKGSSMDASKVAFQQIEETQRTAPIKKGAKLAEATYLIDGQKYQVDLIATQETEEASWLRLFFRAIKDFIVGLFS